MRRMPCCACQQNLSTTRSALQQQDLGYHRFAAPQCTALACYARTCLGQGLMCGIGSLLSNALPAASAVGNIKNVVLC
jgi:hypothetical protein